MLIKKAHFFTAAVSLALVCMVSLTLATMVATDKARQRTACLKVAAAAEHCPLPDFWEKALR
ncbi:hypothetical protein ACI77O_12555 [Pseudomonas tritici]|uniref:hypothetical protein n=1 Tax=Pseudomonas tritici TaxID=2745518 RepID=UPI00387B79FA